MSHPSFVGIHELDREILLELDDESLDRACLVDKWTQSICANPLFWRERTLRTYGLPVLQHKPLGETFRHQYRRLRRLQYDEFPYHAAIRHREFDGLLALKKKGADPLMFDLVYYAARHGNPEILDWLIGQGLRPERFFFHDAEIGDSPENLEWGYQHIRPFNQTDPSLAGLYGAIKILKHLFQKYNVLPNLSQFDLNTLAHQGKLEILIWLDQHNLGLPDQSAANLVGRIINYIKQEGSLTDEERTQMNRSIFVQPISESLRARINRNRPSDLPWDTIKNYLTREETDQILRKYEDLLAWLISRGAY